MNEPTDHSRTISPCQRPKISPAPNWVSIFTNRPDLDPPGYNEAFIDMQENKKKTLREIHTEQMIEKRKKKKLGRGQKA